MIPYAHPHLTISNYIGIVLREGAEVEPYEPLIRKFSSVLVSLELEGEFLFDRDNKNRRLPALLQEVFESVTRTGEVFIEIEKSNFLVCQLFSSQRTINNQVSL